MDVRLRWALGLGLFLFVVTAPIVYYRWDYAEGKRLREVDPGKFYRCGQLTANGFRRAITALGIRTVINVQDEFPDPDLRLHFFSGQTVKETNLCSELGVRYVHLTPDVIKGKGLAGQRPQAIEPYLAILDNPASYPVLIHCKAGLHRTGVLTAVYRMEFQGWTPQQAIADLKANGFAEEDCTSANDYVSQYVLTYQPGLRAPWPLVRAKKEQAAEPGPRTRD